MYLIFKTIRGIWEAIYEILLSLYYFSQAHY